MLALVGNDRIGIVKEVSQLIVDTDNLVQGLKRHWLLRSAFKKEKNPAGSPTPLRPRDTRR